VIQRFIFRALKQGIDAITADPSLLEIIFENFELEEGEVDSIIQKWESAPPHVRHGFARSDDTFPLFAVVLVDEHEAETVLSDDGGIVEDPEDPLFGADVRVSFWEHNYNILVYSDHPDVTLYWYEVAKSIMLEAGFFNVGIYDLLLSGADIEPDPNYIPSHLFVRYLSVKANREFKRIVHTSRLEKAFRVVGIHIDRSGSPSDPGPVKTLLVPYTEGSDD
jgi:hypothetical protein